MRGARERLEASLADAVAADLARAKGAGLDAAQRVHGLLEHLARVVDDRHLLLALERGGPGVGLVVAGSVGGVEEVIELGLGGLKLGHKALDVAPFEMALEEARLAVAATSPAHLTPAGNAAPGPDVRTAEPWEITHSGNSVSLEQELIKAGDVSRAYRLNTGVLKAFHRMILASAKV